MAVAAWAPESDAQSAAESSSHVFLSILDTQYGSSFAETSVPAHSSSEATLQVRPLLTA